MLLPFLCSRLLTKLDLVLQGGALLPESDNLSLVLVQGRPQHDPVPLCVSALVLELVQLVTEVVVRLLDHAEGTAEALVLPHAALDLQVLLPELHLELAHPLLAGLYLVFQREPLLGECIDLLLERHLDEPQVLDVDVLRLQLPVELEYVVVLLGLNVLNAPDLG